MAPAWRPTARRARMPQIVEFTSGPIRPLGLRRSKPADRADRFTSNVQRARKASSARILSSRSVAVGYGLPRDSRPNASGSVGCDEAENGPAGQTRVGRAARLGEATARRR